MISTPDTTARTETAGETYLIRKGGAYYRPNAQGYTHSLAEAGRFTLEEAFVYSHPNGPDGPRDGIDYVPAPAETAETVTVPPAPEGMLPLRINEHTPSVILCANGDRIPISWRDQNVDKSHRHEHERAEQAAAYLVAIAALASPQHPAGVREADIDVLRGEIGAAMDGSEDGTAAADPNFEGMVEGVLRAVLPFTRLADDPLATLSHPPAQDAPGADWRETERNDYVSDAQARDLFGVEDDEELPEGRVRVCDGEWVRIPGGYYFDKSAGPLHREVASEVCDRCAVSIDPSPPLPEAEGDAS